MRLSLTLTMLMSMLTDREAAAGWMMSKTEDHSAGNALRYGASTKCWNRGYTYEYSRQNGTLENDDAKIGYHDYKNNYAILDGSVLLLNWEETLKPINRWIVK